MKSVVCLVLFGVLCSACIRPAAYVPDLEDVLEENPRLQRVLEHCRDDSLKYEAAVFLMKNHTRGHDERIFEYRDGGQIFW